MKTLKKISKSRRNYYVDSIAFLPFFILIITGIIMLSYHTGTPYSDTFLNKDGNFWLYTHKFFAVVSLVIIALHLSLHLNWFKKLLSGNQKNKYWIRNLILVILFLLVTLTSVLPWLILEESDTASLLLGVHNKIGLLLIVFFVIHLFSYFKWLLNMRKKVIGENQMF